MDRNFYAELHRMQDEYVSLETTIPLERRWDCPESFFRGKAILEAGSGGQGAQTSALKRLGASPLMVVDLSEENIDDVRENLTRTYGSLDGVTFRVMDLGREPLPAGAFDIVHCHGVFQHILDKDGALRNFYQALKPEGHLMVAVYGHGGLLALGSGLLRLPFRLVPRGWAIRFFALFIPSQDTVSDIIDHLYVPVQTRYRAKAFARYVESFGFRLERYLGRNPQDHRQVPYKTWLYRVKMVYLSPHSSHRIPLLSWLFFGSGGHAFIFRKPSGQGD